MMHEMTTKLLSHQVTLLCSIRLSGYLSNYFALISLWLSVYFPFTNVYMAMISYLSVSPTHIHTVVLFFSSIELTL